LRVITTNTTDAHFPPGAIHTDPTTDPTPRPGVTGATTADGYTITGVKNFFSYLLVIGGGVQFTTHHVSFTAGADYNRPLYGVSARFFQPYAGVGFTF
jgi:hypothetical protein